MGLPFTTEQFLAVFEKYNLAVWPMQILFFLLAVIAVFLACRQMKYSQVIIPLVLSLFWLWTGIVYHLLSFTAINKGAYLFAALFIIQGLIFLYSGVFKRDFNFHFESNLNSVIGLILVAYALLVYPLLGLLLGHTYPKSPTFPLPCPLTIFTFGLLLSNRRRLSFLVIIIPFIWSLIGSSAAFSLGVREDIGLLISGLTAMGLAIFNRKNAAV